MKVTEEKIEANRKNPIKHGLRASQVLINGESESEFASFQKALFYDLSPVGALEENLAALIVADFWRLRRVVNLEKQSFQNHREKQERFSLIDKNNPNILGKAISSAKQVSFYSTISGYEFRINSRLHKNLSALKILQQKSKAN